MPRERRSVPSPAVQLITGPWRDLPDLRNRVEAALRGGIRWVQLRAKERGGRELHEAACAIAPLLREAGALFVINDRIDVAIAVGADGVHLGEKSMPARDARRLLGAAAWIGRSLHSVEDIAAIGGQDIDAIQFGPVFPTPSKLEYGEPQGLVALERAHDASKRGCRAAMVAVGGISAERAVLCRDAGATAVAVIGAIWNANDPEWAASLFLKS